MKYNATTTRIFGLTPYFFFAMIGVVCASSLFILLLLKYGFSISRYTKIFLLSGIGLIIGGNIFGFFSRLYVALANNEPINIDTFVTAGFVFYGGLIGFLLTFLLICKIWNKKIDYKIMDLVAVCIPLFHLWGRIGCFFAGCCYGIETHSMFSILYTTSVSGEIITASRIPIQLIESSFNILLFAILLTLLIKHKFKKQLMIIYLSAYAIMRIIIEFFRGDLHRGVWNGISFSQVVSVVILIICTLIINYKRIKGERI